MSVRTQSNSVCEAEGKPTSISLKPMRNEHFEHFQLFLDVHRLHQRLVAVAQVPPRTTRWGPFPSRREGHWRSGSVIGGQGTYFFMAASPSLFVKKASAPVGAKACFAVPPNFTACGGDLSAR